MIKLNRPPAPRGHTTRASHGTAALWDHWREKATLPKIKASIYAHKDVKKKLRDSQHNKCAFCESLNPTSHDVVEHYRPKNGWQQNKGDPINPNAYFWLAYDWDNFLLACDTCNDQAHKGNVFPLIDPARRASVNNPNISDEEPLLINPKFVDPSVHIEWNRDIPRARNYDRHGLATIEILGLDRDGLMMDQRRKYYNDINEFISAAESLEVGIAARNSLIKVLLCCLKDDAPWAGMIRHNFENRIHALQELH